MKKYLSILGFLLLISCNTSVKQEIKKVEKEELKTLTESSYNSMGVYISSTKTNEIIINWSEEIDTSHTNVLKFKILNTKTNILGKEITVKPSVGMQAHHESMAKVIRNGNGTLYAIFRLKSPNPKNKYAGSIFYSISKDDGKTWSEKRKLVNDSSSQSQSFFDVELLPNGEIGLCWLDNRKLEKEKDGSSLYFAITSNDEGFLNEKPIVGSTCQCCRTDIFVFKNTINVGFRNIEEDNIRDMYLTQSVDNAETFSSPIPMGKDNWKIFGCPHTGPSLAHNNNELAVAWYTGANSGTGLYFKKLTDEITLYENKTSISSTGLHPQMIALENCNYYIVYEDLYKVEDKTFNHIILHTIMPDETEVKMKLSKKNTMNDHPVIHKINENKLLIAWVNKVEGKTKIKYTNINL